jgi:hypothetical protein
MSRARRGTGDERGVTDPCLRSGPANVKARCSPEREKSVAEGGDFRRQATPARRLKAERSDVLQRSDLDRAGERRSAIPVIFLPQIADKLARLKMVFVR